MIEQYFRYVDFLNVLKVDEFGTRKIVPFALNGPQRRLAKSIALAHSKGEPYRGVILKSRQAGFSTFIQSWMLHRGLTSTNFKGVTVAHQASNTGVLFEMGSNMYQRLPDELQAEVFQKAQRRGNRMLFSNDSDLVVETANDPNAGRGGNFSAMHLSEVAFWGSDSRLTSRSLRQGIQEKAGGLLIMESTPNGIGGLFYDEYMRAKEGASDYEAIFEPWYRFERNMMRVREHHFNGQGEFIYESEEELRLTEAYELSPEQVMWYRYTLANKCEGNEDTFKQEYPSDDISCFLTSGRLYFTSILVNRFLPTEPALIGDVADRKSVVAAEKGPLWQYQEPEEGRKYVIFIDPAGIQGDHHTGTDAEEDYSVCWVMRRHDMQTCAVWRDRVDPDVLAKVANDLGYYYNRAMLCPEINGEGMVVLFKLKDIHRYANLYRRQILDIHGEPETEKEGWRTTSLNRPAMLSELSILLRDDHTKLADERLKREMATFIVANRKPQAKAGEHDDLVMAAAGAVQICIEHPHTLHLDDEGKPLVWQQRNLKKAGQPSYYL